MAPSWTKTEMTEDITHAAVPQQWPNDNVV